MKTLTRIVTAALAALAWLGANPNVSADVLAGWEANGLSNSGPSPYAPTALNLNVNVGGLSRGSGVTSTTTANVWGGSGWNVTSESAAVSGSKFATFTVQATPGYTLSLTSVSRLFFTRSATGPTNGVLQFSTNGTVFTDIASIPYGVSGTASTNNTNVDLSGVAALQNLSSNITVTFRLVNWGATSAAGTWYINNGTNGSDLEISGSLASIGVPPRNLTVTPASITNNFGGTSSFTVTAGGDLASNFWYKVASGATNLIPSATNATLTLSNLSQADTANYFVVLSNASGTNVSSQVSLTVIDPAILVQPASQPALLDGTAVFSVSAVGSSIGYQWYFCDLNTNLIAPVSNGTQSSGSVVSGSATSTLTITNLQAADATNFAVVISNSFGNVVTSAVASLLYVSNHASLVYWDFNGTDFSNHIASPLPYYGTGTALTVGSPNTPGTSPFSGSVDPADGVGFAFNNHLPNFSWGTSSYPLTGGNKLNGVQFNTSTVGAKNIKVSYDSRVSATASDYERLQYTTNGTDWIDYPTSSSFNGHATTYFPFSYDLTGFPGVANNPSFGIRVVTEFQSTAAYGVGTTNTYSGTGNTYGTAGTVTYDIVNVSGDAITNNNNPPTISPFPNTNTTDFTPITLNFTVNDLETPPDSLILSAISLNPLKVSPGFTFGGSGTSRTLTITPNTIQDSTDAAPIYITVKDGNGDITATWFILTLTSINVAPTNSLVNLTATNTLANTPISIPFLVGDDRTAPNNLTFSTNSGNNTVIPSSNIVVSGTGTNRILTVTPASNQVGLASISVTVNDNDATEPRSTTANIAFMVRPNTNVVAVDYFSYDNGGALDSVSAGFWGHLSGNFGQMQVGSGIVTVDTLDNTENLQIPLLGGPFRTNSGGTLYSSFIINMADPDRQPRNNGTYFALFNDGSGVTGNYEGRVVVATNGVTNAGDYRLGIVNFGGDATSAAMYPQELIQHSNYVVVTSLVLSNGFSTLWINPASPSSQSVTDTSPAPNPTNLFNIADYELRESGSDGGSVSLSKLKVGTTFDSVLPALHPQMIGTNVVVIWSDPTLSIQSAPDITNSVFTDLPGVTTPYTNTNNAPQMYFRFKRN